MTMTTTKVYNEYIDKHLLERKIRRWMDDCDKMNDDLSLIVMKDIIVLIYSLPTIVIGTEREDD